MEYDSLKKQSKQLAKRRKKAAQSRQSMYSSTGNGRHFLDHLLSFRDAWNTGIFRSLKDSEIEFELPNTHKNNT